MGDEDPLAGRSDAADPRLGVLVRDAVAYPTVCVAVAILVGAAVGSAAVGLLVAATIAVAAAVLVLTATGGDPIGRAAPGYVRGSPGRLDRTVPVQAAVVTWGTIALVGLFLVG